MNVYILGHGCILTKANPRVGRDVHTYVNEGEMLSDYYIPGIIQIESGLLNLDLSDLFNRESVDGNIVHIKNADFNCEHGLFCTTGDNPMVCQTLWFRNDDNELLKEVWNCKDIPPSSRNPSDKYYYLTKNANKNLDEIEVVTFLNQQTKLLIYNLFSTYDIIVCPNQEVTEDDPILLSSIITEIDKKYPFTCHFFWLACREYNN